MPLKPVSGLGHRRPGAGAGAFAPWRLPIVDYDGAPIAALNIGIHASRWAMQKLTQEAPPLLKQTAALFSALLAPDKRAKER